jgi:ubiquitin C-terminal hydrolase
MILFQSKIQKKRKFFFIFSFFLVCFSIRHQGTPNAGKYVVAIEAKAQGNWFEIDSLLVQETHPQKISLSESYIQIYERVLE